MQTQQVNSRAVSPVIQTATTANNAASPADFSDMYAAAKGAPIIGFVDSAIDRGFFFGVSDHSGPLSIDDIGASLKAAMPVFEDNMRRACTAYHIPVPPPLQLVVQPDGTISAPPGDPRAAQVTAMFEQQPELANQYRSMISAADMVGNARDQEAYAMVKAVYGEAIANAALLRWKQNETRNNNEFGIRFDGPSASLQERVGGQWRQPRSVAEIADEMIPGANFVSAPSTIDAILGAA